jgi:hypothetical protein
LKDGDNGRLIIKCQAGCDWHDVADELRRRGLYNGQASSTGAAAHVYRGDLRDYAVKLWRQSVPIKGTLAERYLRDVRKITIPMPPTIRFHRAKCALIAAVSNEDHKVLSAQLTFIDRATCTKINRKTFGRMLDGAARLGAATSILGLAEGLETALSSLSSCVFPAGQR